MSIYPQLADYHMHTPLCRHAEGWPVDLAARAVELGLAEIGFSDHSPMPSDGFDDWRMSLSDLPRYLEEVEKARAAFPQLPIRLGMEVDWLKGGEAWLDQLAGCAEWDYLIGSVHYVGEWNFDSPYAPHRQRWSDFGVEAAWDHYWALFADCARSKRFEILGHADLIKKFGHRPEGDLRRWYVPAVEALRESGAAFEINTAGLFKDVQEMYPAEEFVRLACEAGVPLTINSDAHAPGEVGRAFPEAEAMARRCGYTETVRFVRRARHAVPL